MKQNIDPITELKRCLTLQLEAHLEENWNRYNDLEAEIQEIEKQL